MARDNERTAVSIPGMTGDNGGTAVSTPGMARGQWGDSGKHARNGQGQQEFCQEQREIQIFLGNATSARAGIWNWRKTFIGKKTL